MKAIYKKFEDQEKRNNGRFEELIKMIGDTKEASTSGSIEVRRKVAENLDENPVHRAENATNIGGNIHPRTLGYTPNIKFPRFATRKWIKKCIKYWI